MLKSSVSSRHRSLLHFAVEGITTLAKVFLLLALQVYQVLFRPLIGPACRFAPSCSLYAAEAIERHGPLRGLLLTIQRVGRCHPWNPGGYDPVPERSR
jgi:putative membrane protein insertion efficiency factor